MAKELLKPAMAIRKFVGTDCCKTGRTYVIPTAKELKEFKDFCDIDEYEKLGMDAALHLAAHD